MNSILFKIAAKTDQGKVRENNEDNFLISQNLANNEWFCPQNPDQPIELSDKGCLLAVADGMGGMNAGEEASKIAIEVIRELFEIDKFPEDDELIESCMREVVFEADRRIKEKAANDDSLEGMGTTIVFVWIHGGKAHLTWCGDSRAYIFHPDSGLKQLSKDHSYVQELVDEGVISQDAAFDHPDNNIITRSLGDTYKRAESDYLEYTLHRNETILLCSDGLNGELRDCDIEGIIRNNDDSLKSCCDKLINEALKAGGNDNVTVAICKIVEGLSDLDVSEHSDEAKEPEVSTFKTTKAYVSSNTSKRWKYILLIAIALIGLLIGLCGILQILA